MIRPGQLTDREWAVASLVGRGEKTRMVAAVLHVSPRTVESHLASVYRKLGVASRAGLAALLSDGQFLRDADADSMPPTRYANCVGRCIAYQVFGHGPADIVMVPGLASHLEMLWEQASWRRFMARLSEVGRVIVFDKRGTGLSDPVDRTETLSLDQRMTDTLAVLDAVGSERALMFGLSEGGPMGLYAAVAHPDRIGALCVYGSAVLGSVDARERRRRLVSLVEATFGQGQLGAKLWPSLAAAPGGLAWLARYERHVSSPSMIVQLMSMNIDIDLSGILDSVRIPVSIVHNVDDPVVPYEEAERLAAALPHAKLVPVTGIDHMPWGEIDTGRLIGEIGALAAQMNEQPLAPTVLRALVAVADASPEEAPRIEDWIASCGGSSRRHERCIIGLFDSVDRARRCATTLPAILPTVRIAAHTGEVEDSPRAVRGRAIDELLRVVITARPGKPILTGLMQELDV